MHIVGQYAQKTLGYILVRNAYFCSVYNSVSFLAQASQNEVWCALDGEGKRNIIMH